MCDRLEIPAFVAVMTLSGKLEAARLEHHPEREKWRIQYQEELVARQEGGESARQLKHRQARQIATTFKVPLDVAFSILSGSLPPIAVDGRERQSWESKQHNLEKEERRQEQRRIEQFNRRRNQWLKTATATLQELGLPDAMIGNILPNKAVVDPDTSPADVALDLWLKRLQQSGFTDSRELVAAWQQYGIWTAAGLRLAREKARERQDREANAGMRGERVASLCRRNA